MKALKRQQRFRLVQRLKYLSVESILELDTDELLSAHRTGLITRQASHHCFDDESKTDFCLSDGVRISFFLKIWITSMALVAQALSTMIAQAIGVASSGLDDVSLFSSPRSTQVEYQFGMNSYPSVILCPKNPNFQISLLCIHWRNFVEKDILSKSRIIY